MQRHLRANDAGSVKRELPAIAHPRDREREKNGSSLSPSADGEREEERKKGKTGKSNGVEKTHHSFLSQMIFGRNTVELSDQCIVLI